MGGFMELCYTCTLQFAEAHTIGNFIKKTKLTHEDTETIITDNELSG